MNKPLIARKRSTGCIPTRYVLAILGHIGFANVYALRVNLSVAIIDMKDQYGWSSTTEGLILSSFFFGYIFTQVPGGWLAERYGGKWVMGLGCLGTVVLSVLTPLAAHYGLGYLIALRVLEGIGEGVTFPAMHSMWSHWAPPYERTILTTLCYTGAWMGNIIAFPLSGVLAQHGFVSEGHRWPSIFYVFGAVGFLWCIAWFFLVHSYPSTHPRISTEERNFIESSIPQKTEVAVPTPWRAIMTSPAFWSVIVSHLCNNWAAYTLLTNMPTFFKDVHHIGIMKGGIFSALPYVVIVIVIPSGGTLTDFMRRTKILSTTQARKLMNCLGQILPAVFLIGTGFASSQALAVVLLAISVGFNGLSYSGFNVNHLDIAPRFAGTLMGITNTAGTVSGIVAPYVAGALASAPSGTHVLAEEWRNVFYLGAEIQIFGALIFLILGSGEEQWWANGTSMPESQTSSLSLPHGKVQRDF
ncbi:vesicular glutamate transporter 3-like [Oscarella lobularis]|uniref:vesicular glutamate transporter 3-like n=1 Tax=Oscarella lobularis TaxID=121494 RepID=UPI0033134D1B